MLKSLGRADLLILDDWGLEPLDAILDRLVHNAHRIELTGESLRRARGKQAKTA
jgi:DNA replication protein DnaC